MFALNPTNRRDGWVIPVWVRVFFLCDFFLAAAYAAIVWVGVHPGKFAQFFDLDEEANLPAWYSSMQLAGAGALVALYAWRNEDAGRGRRSVVWLLAAVLTLLSLDESAQIHEWVGDRASLLFGAEHWGSFFERTRNWTLFISIPLAVLVVWMLRQLAGLFSAVPRATALLALGFALLLFSAEGIEQLGDWLSGKAGWYSAEVCAEELGEMLGGTLLLWGGGLLAAHAFGITGDLLPRPLPQTSPQSPPAASRETASAKSSRPL